MPGYRGTPVYPLLYGACVTVKSRDASTCLTDNFGAPADLHRTPARLGLHVLEGPQPGLFF
jgi:hypothetical protein